LRDTVEVLARSPRTPGSAEHRRSAEHVAGRLQAAGFVVEEMHFRSAGRDGLNLLTRPRPDRADLPLVLIGAHYDTVPGSPGADDNASAVAALLELASWIGPRLTEGGCVARLQLAAYDLEEAGGLGSAAHCQRLEEAGTLLRGMIALEMLGYADSRPGSQNLPAHLRGLYPDVGNFIGVIGNEASRDLLQPVTAGLKSVPGLPVESLAVPGTGTSLPDVRRSDHRAFWDRGFQALMITDTSFLRNPHYHQASDTPQTLDYAFLAKVTAGVCEAVRSLVERVASAG
jgi:Zn-dependent M28 family amino/carboxypeptidase